MSFLKVGLVFAIPTIAKLAAGLIVVKVIAIYLGVDGLGRIGQFMSLMSMLTVLAGGGISIGIVKYVAEFQDKKNQLSDYIQTASCVTLGYSIFLTAVLFILDEKISVFLFKTPLYAFEIRVLAFSQIAIGLSSFFLGILNGLRQAKAFAFVSLASVFFGAIGVVIGCKWGGFTGAMYGMMWFSSCQLIFLVIWYYWSFNKDWRLLKPRWLPEIAKKFTLFSFMQLVTVLTMQLAQIIIRNLIEQKTNWIDVGYWQGLVKISDAYLLFITVVLANYYMPKLSELKEKSEVIREVIAAYKIVIPTLLLFIPIIFACRNAIVITLYSEKFLAISDLFFWQIIGDFLKVIAYISGYVAVAKAASKIYISAEIFQAGLLIILSFFLVTHYGVQGAVYAYVITYFIYASVSLFCLRLYAKKR